MPRIDEGGPGGGPIQYPTILQTLGLDYEQDWGSSSQDALRNVRFSYASAHTFGEIPAAKDFASIYVAAQHIYEATLRGIREDLTAAAQALSQAGAEIRERDEASGDAFRTLQARWGQEGEGSSSTQQTEQATDDEPAREGSEAQVRLQDQQREEPGAGPDGPEPAVDTTPTGGEPPTTTTPSSGMDVD